VRKSKTVVLAKQGLKLSSGKTSCTHDIISGAIKADKLKQLRTRAYDRSLQKHLLLIHQHAQEFPIAGSVARALSFFYRRISKVTKLRSSVSVLLSIITDIAFQNPRCYPHAAAIISKLLSLIADASERASIVHRIRTKIERLPNTGYMQLWLQRAAIELKDSLQFDDSLCKLVAGDLSTIWDSSWISSPALKASLDSKKIINQKILNETMPVIPYSEVELFSLVES
jgi:RNA-directed DNA polymerase